MVSVLVFSHVQRHDSLVSELSTTHGTRNLEAGVSIDGVHRARDLFSWLQICTLSGTLLVVGVSSERPKALPALLTVINLGAEKGFLWIVFFNNRDVLLLLRGAGSHVVEQASGMRIRHHAIRALKLFSFGMVQLMRD